MNMNIGKTIADLRKQNNMTQSEVADILGVSYQAVSKWERNESLPDITLLPQIADLFHITIDQLFKGEFDMNQEEAECAKEIVHNSSNLNDSITEFVNHEFENGSPTSDELADKISNFVEDSISKTFSTVFESFMPLMKPNNIKEIVKNKKSEIKSFSKKGYHYLDDETILSLLENIETIDDESYDLLVDIASNASNTTKDMIVEKLCISDLEGLDLSDIIIYLNAGQKSKLITHLLEIHYHQDDLLECLPFLNNDHKDMILDYICENGIDEDILDEILPFLNTNHKEKLILNHLDQLDKDIIIDCCPFLNKEILNEVINYYINHNELEDLEDFYPFLSNDTKKHLMNAYASNKMFDEISDLLDFMK